MMNKRFLAFLLLGACLLISCKDSDKESANTCETDADCGSAERPYCDGFSGCEACVLHAHCPLGQRCEDNECTVPATCETDEDCDAQDAEICNWILGECTGCFLDEHCGENQICTEEGCVDVHSCVNSLGCAEGTVCNRERGYCVECDTDVDCEETHACVETECIPRCESDKDCTAAGELCDKQAGHCVKCVENADCPALYHCSAGSCVVDTCLADTITCDGNSNGFLVCDAAGANQDFVPCGPATTCVDSPDGAECRVWSCSPGTLACSEDFDELLRCDDDGLGMSVQADCEKEGGTCDNLTCAEVACEPETRFCMNGAVMQCSRNGASFFVQQQCDATTQYCSEEVDTCVAHECIPNTATCDGNKVRTCKEDGSGYDTKKCDDDEACFNGACSEKVCDPDDTSSYCKDDQVRSCVNNGTVESLVQDCGTTRYCEDGSCKLNTCTPGDDICDGNVAGTCNDSGDGLDKDGQTDCDDTSEGCLYGSCAPIVCTGGTYYCDNNRVYRCNENGTSGSLSTTCSSNQYCDDSTTVGLATCKARICTPDTVSCYNNTISVCNDDGSGYDPGGTACGSTEACVQGTCLPVICQPNSYFCKPDGNVWRCGSDGTTEQVADNCSLSEHCIDGNTTCTTDVCTADQPTCDGNAVATCAADGSGPLSDGVPCGTGTACDGGACKAVFCSPDEEYCEGDIVRTCNDTGTGYKGSVGCSSSYYCDLVAVGDAECLRDICVSGQPACRGETIATCSSSGGPTDALGTDCSASGTFCDGTSCVSQVVETVGGQDSLSNGANYRIANRYYFGRSRHLTNIEQYMNIPGTNQLTWFVYEANGTSSSSFTKIFEKLTTSSGDAYHSSGVIDVQLDPDKYYMIGVRSDATCTYPYVSTLNAEYLASSGFALSSEYTYNSGTLSTSWSISPNNAILNQRLTLE
jgi:hypothetical protein